jgi:hypothetical protein
MIDIWSQWDLAFGEHADELRHHFHGSSRYITHADVAYAFQPGPATNKKMVAPVARTQTNHTSPSVTPLTYGVGTATSQTQPPDSPRRSISSIYQDSGHNSSHSNIMTHDNISKKYLSANPVKNWRVFR